MTKENLTFLLMSPNKLLKPRGRSPSFISVCRVAIVTSTDRDPMCFGSKRMYKHEASVESAFDHWELILTPIPTSSVLPCEEATNI